MRRIAVEFDGLLSGEREQLAFFLDDHVVDLEFRVGVDHRGDHLAAVALAFRDRADPSLEVADDLAAHGRVDFTAGGENGCRGADDTAGFEPDFISAGGNERAGGNGLAIDVGDRFSREFFQRLEHVEGDIQRAAGGFHIEHDGVHVLLDRLLQSAAEDEQFRFGDLRTDRNDDHLRGSILLYVWFRGMRRSGGQKRQRRCKYPGYKVSHVRHYGWG